MKTKVVVFSVFLGIISTTMKVVQTMETGEISNGANNEISAGNQITYNKVIGNICNSSNSFEYCKCNENVVSCDLTHFPGSDENRTIVHIHGQSMNPAVKRFCLCNAPSHIEMHLDENLLPYNNSIHRVDIFNLSGPLEVKYAFNLKFSGDLHISNVYLWKNLHSIEFGRGNDMEIKDVEDIECCSKIKSSPVFHKPTLHLENITISHIHGKGVGGDHLWKTVILNSVIVGNVSELGINLEDVPDISITNSVFHNVGDGKEPGIRIMRFVRLLFAQNYVGYRHHKTFVAKSSHPNSSILNLENHFDVPYFWSMDAKWVVNWFNHYYLWDSYSFLWFNRTKLLDRKVSVEYNTVEIMYSQLNYSSFAGNKDDYVFNENTLGMCNCSSMQDPQTLPMILDSSRCRITLKSKSNRTCLINYKLVIEECKKGDVDENAYFNMCHALPQVKPVISSKEIRHSFYEKMLKKVRFHFKKMETILFTEGVKDAKMYVFGHQHKISIHDAWVIICLVVFGLISSVTGILCFRKRRRNRLYRDPVGSSLDLLSANI